MQRAPSIGRRFLLVREWTREPKPALSVVVFHTMARLRKITVKVPAELLVKAQKESGAGITQTVRTGLQLVVASRAYTRLRQLRGKVRFSRNFAELKSDRRE